MGRRWTDQDIEDLKRMAQYCSAPKIAELNGALVPEWMARSNAIGRRREAVLP